MLLLTIALFGLLVPNGLFFYYMFTEFNGWHAVLTNTLALAFIIDAFMVTALLAVYFALRPPGPFRWFWFVILALAGGLGFSVPFYWWLNKHRGSPPAGQPE